MTRVLRAADIFLENGVHKHAIQQTFSLWEPGGNGVEVANAGARLILAPDLKPIKSFHTHGTPPV